MEFSRFANFLVASFMMAVFIAGFSFTLKADNFYVLSQPASVATVQISIIVEEPVPIAPVEILPEKLASPPEIIKAAYVTGWSAGNKSYLNYLTDLFKTTEINAVVIDIKDYSGLISYPLAIPDINALVRFFHGQNIYVIGRIAVFEDPAFSQARPDLAIFDKVNGGLWLDNHKLSWLDPASKKVWDYNISIAKNVLLHGFDEVNFDYIRFPSDGKTQNMGFPFWDGKTERRVVLKNFFEYLRQNLPDAKLSADLFGQATVNSDDLSIGQIIEDALEYFDYVCPMVYPAHYAENFMGFSNPAEHPYEVVKYSMQTALAKKTANKNSIAKLRPWLQDFNMGATYTFEMVKSEITATEDALKDEYNGYMLWSPSNIYTKEAIWKTLLK